MKCSNDCTYQATARKISVGILILLLVLVTGCSTKYGLYKRDADVQQAFEANQLPQDYKYFHFSASEPYVLLGLDNEYFLKSKMWREVSADTEEFKEMVLFIWEDYGYNKFGASLYNLEGEKIGILYTSIREIGVQFLGENEIAVIPHTPYLWGPNGSHWNP